MIFPDVSLQDWLKKYPELEVITRSCDACGALMHATKPFLEKGYAGLVTVCPCGGRTHQAMSCVTTSKEESREWSEILSHL